MPMKLDEDSVLIEMAQYQVFITLFISLMIRDSKYINIIELTNIFASLSWL
jgi:hypothetical protein